MNPLLLEILPWIKKGYCCSQLLILLILEAAQKENPDLIKASRGLGYGIGQSNGPCGLLTGGACALAFLAEAKDEATLQSVLNEYATWFYERVAPYGGDCNCGTICQGLGNIKANNASTIDMNACGDLLADCWQKILDLIGSYEII